MKTMNNIHFSNSYLNLLINMREIKKHLHMNKEEIEQLQQIRFKKLLKHVLENSVFYKKYYGENGININNYEKVKIEDLPIIDKLVVMENFDELVCDDAIKKKELEEFISNPLNKDKKYKNLYNVVNTSGSSGTIGMFIYGPNEWDILRASGLVRVTKSKINPFHKIKVGFIGATDGHYAGISLAKSFPNAFSKFLPISINNSTEDILKELDKFQPDILSGYASALNLLAEKQISGNININPKKIISSAEVLTESIRNNIKEAFKINPINFYAASESIGMACECEDYHGMHLFNDLYCFEVVDKNLKVLPNGQSGNLLITNLFNYTQPLIRYKMNDEIILDNKACKCSWPFPLMKTIAGREEDFLWFEKADGSKAYIHPLVMAALFVEGLKKFKVIQTSMNSIKMQVIIGNDKEKITKSIHHKMYEVLQEKELENVVKVTIEEVTELENDKLTGKFKLIVPFKHYDKSISDMECAPTI